MLECSHSRLDCLLGHRYWVARALQLHKAQDVILPVFNVAFLGMRLVAAPLMSISVIRECIASGPPQTLKRDDDDGWMMMAGPIQSESVCVALSFANLKVNPTKGNRRWCAESLGQ